MTLSQKPVDDVAQLSDPYITYRNVAISLKGRRIKLDKVSDLKSYSLVGF